MRLLGHRGASADHPENTIEAFDAAMRGGAAGVELDVMRCATGELVVCHDERLERLAKLPWHVRYTPWWRLKRVDVGTALGFKPARMPLLDDVFDALPASAMVNVELKCDTFDDGGLAEAVGSLLIQRRLTERVIVSSFNAVCLARLAAAFPRVPRGVLLDPDKAWWPQAWLTVPMLARTSVHPSVRDCTPERVNWWHATGLQVAVWTVDDLEDARSLRAMGVDWCITNRPGALTTALRGG